MQQPHSAVDGRRALLTAGPAHDQLHVEQALSMFTFTQEMTP